ncbi:MAG: DUF4093 domain-containing protein [Oscillospiraceae bacterium]|jgi:ribonuclease M5|nr:DUF4093 domain-containing protein [Oscillospiraceae bacterium]
MTDRIVIGQAVAVEGKYDKIKLEGVIDGVIIPVNGFRIFSDGERLALLRAYADASGVIILTDGDDAGRQIRNFLARRLEGGKVSHAYVPALLEVQDAPAGVLREAFSFARGVRAGSSAGGASPAPARGVRAVTRGELYDGGFIGVPGASERRRELLRRLGVPENLSVTALLELLNARGEYFR